jgi:molecular chaperone HtpG
MKPEQEAIYILIGDDAEALASSPQLEGFRARGLEVLLLSDPVDAFWPERLTEYEGKPIRSVTQGVADLDKFTTEAVGEKTDVAKLVETLKAALGDQVDDVRATDRLVDSAVVLSAKSSGPDLQLQRLMRRTGRAGPNTPPMLEINPCHKLIASLAARAEAGEDLKDTAETLLDLARIQDGEPPRNPAAFAKRVTEALGS